VGKSERLRKLSRTPTSILFIWEVFLLLLYGRR
jgi:hypothetical protein